MLLPLAALGLTGCGVNSVPTAEEKVNKEFADLQADYQRRNDLIPNLVEVVKGYAKQERDVLIRVTEARAGANSVQLTPADLSDPAKVQAYNDAQSRVSAALVPFRQLQEAYPDLKSNDNFKMLQDQVEGSENRINTSRQDYNTAVQEYNTTIRTFPDAIGAKIFYGAKPKVPFQASAGAQEAPKINMSN
jgi:LemA protein